MAGRINDQTGGVIKVPANADMRHFHRALGVEETFLSKKTGPEYNTLRWRSPWTHQQKESEKRNWRSSSMANKDITGPRKPNNERMRQGNKQITQGPQLYERHYREWNGKCRGRPERQHPACLFKRVE
ncbi:hypothetical protein WA026_023658 [Henosepilachna vigintioctopunctata]|uniref:Uncharacterized protein n=1 Tax=Henosepilachna vigintioctopunctata TaxID=420089 RepID=A0AAW1V2P9_9CUCU